MLATLLGYLVVCRAARADGRERHVRIHSSHGPIHVWTPAAYDAATAATVVYVHGYDVDVDDAWREYHLRDQFAASGINALFVVCEAPTSDRAEVASGSLPELLAVVTRSVGGLPLGRLVAVGHSGAHRTIGRWLAEPDLDTIVLLDAGYGDLSAYGTWLASRDARRLIDVGDLTTPWTDAFHDTLPQTRVIDRFPTRTQRELAPDVRDAAIIYVRSHLGHMALVTGGFALPMVLRALDAPPTT